MNKQYFTNFARFCYRTKKPERAQARSRKRAHRET